jgi:hypothetical protein
MHTKSNETSSDTDDDVDDETVSWKPPVRTALPKVLSHLSADDRPITPMRDKMVYNQKNSSLDFDDGKIGVTICGSSRH